MSSGQPQAAGWWATGCDVTGGLRVRLAHGCVGMVAVKCAARGWLPCMCTAVYDQHGCSSLLPAGPFGFSLRSHPAAGVLQTACQLSGIRPSHAMLYTTHQHTRINVPLGAVVGWVGWQVVLSDSRNWDDGRRYWTTVHRAGVVGVDCRCRLCRSDICLVCEVLRPFWLAQRLHT
jgi:hypothetical protein